MDRTPRKRAEGPVAPMGMNFPRGVTVGVYSTGTRGASATRAIPALDWPDWTDRVRYTVTRARPDSPAGGGA